MRIIRTSGSTNFRKAEDSISEDIIYCDSGCVFAYDGKTITLRRYSDLEQNPPTFKYQGKTYQQYKGRKEDEYRYANQNDSSDEYSIPDIFKSFFRYGRLPADDFSEFFVGQDETDRNDRFLALCNIEKNVKIRLPVESYSGKIVGSFIYVFERNKNNLVKLDFGGNIVWEYLFDFKKTKGSSPFISKNPIVLENELIVYFGPEITNDVIGSKINEFSAIRGVVASLNLSDGSLIWKQELEFGASSLLKHADRLYICAGYSIYAIKISDGKIIAKRELDINPHFVIGAFSSPKLYVDDNYIFVSSPLDRRLIVLASDTLDVVADQAMPQKELIGEFQYKSSVTGRYYFDAISTGTAVPKFISLEVDPRNVYEPIEYDSLPEHSIEMIDSKTSERGKELLISMSNASVSDVIRFGEVIVRDETDRYSFNYMKRTQGDRAFVPVKEFNGIVRFKVINCIDDGCLETHLDTMEKRFNSWTKTEGYYAASDNRKLVTLITETESRKTVRDRLEDTEHVFTNADLNDYICDLENGNCHFLEDQKNSELLRKRCEQVLEKETSAQAHYLLGLYYLTSENTEAAKEHRIKAARLGYCPAIIDLAYQSNFDDFEVLGLLKAMSDSGENLGSAQDNFDDRLAQLPEADKKKVRDHSVAIRENINELGLTFSW